MRSDLAEVELSDVARRRRQARRRTIGVVGVAVMLPVFAILAGPSGGETAPEIAANRTVAFTNAGQDQNAPAAVDGSADESLDLSEPTRRVNLDPVLPSAEPKSSDLSRRLSADARSRVSSSGDGRAKINGDSRAEPNPDVRRVYPGPDIPC